MPGNGYAHILWTDAETGVATALHLFCTTRQHAADVNITEHAVEDGADVTDNARPNPAAPLLECFITQAPIDSFPLGAVQGAVDAIPQTGTRIQGNQTLNPASPFFTPSNPGPLSVKEWFSAGATIGLLLGNLASFQIQDVIFPNSGLSPSTNAPVDATVFIPDQETDNVKATLDILETLRVTSQFVTLITHEATYENVLIRSYNLGKTPDTGTGATVTIEFKTVRIVATTTVDAPKPVDPRGNSTISQGPQSPTTPKTDPTNKSVALAVLQSFGFKLGL